MQRFPFDWRSPLGYLAIMTIQYIMQMYAHKIVACVLVIAAGFYLYSVTAIKSMKISLSSIQRKSHDKNERLREELFEFLEFHSRMKQLSNRLHSPSIGVLI